MEATVNLAPGFAKVPPSTIWINKDQIDLDPIPQGVQVVAFVCSQAIEPVGIKSNNIVGAMDVAKSAPFGTDIVFRVEQDKDLATALAKDFRSRLEQRGYQTRMWLIHKTAHKYTYAYIRILEKHHE